MAQEQKESIDSFHEQFKKLGFCFRTGVPNCQNYPIIDSIISTSKLSYNSKLVKISIFFKFGISFFYFHVLAIPSLLNKVQLSNFRCKFLFKDAHQEIQCLHLQLNPRSVEASGETAISGVNISPLRTNQCYFWDSLRIYNNIFLGQNFCSKKTKI